MDAWCHIPSGPSEGQLHFTPSSTGLRVMSGPNRLTIDMNTNCHQSFQHQKLEHLQVTDTTLYNFLNTVGFFTGSTIRKNQLLRPFPQFRRRRSPVSGRALN